MEAARKAAIAALEAAKSVGDVKQMVVVIEMPGGESATISAGFNVPHEVAAQLLATAIQLIESNGGSLQVVPL